MASYLAIDVGTDRLAAGVVDGAGEVVVRDRVATRHDVARRCTGGPACAAIRDADTLERCGVLRGDRRSGQGHGVAVPAGVAVVRVAWRVGELTGLPTVLGPTAQGRVLAECWKGAERIDDVMVLRCCRTPSRPG
jgi:predicted NBD/HSP70 family sugar kinase